MSKLPKERRFFDLSDYGRPVAIFLANILKSTSVTPVQVTWSFLAVGLVGIWAITKELYLIALLSLVFKSILDAADGELARVKNTPSYTGRYFDSIADWFLNFGIIITIGLKMEYALIFSVLAFISMQLQGTLYNYYYVILRYKYSGDTTSRIIETDTPIAMKGENQTMVDFLFRFYKILYAPFDKIIYSLDKSAAIDRKVSPRVMSLVSSCGLGFQLLLIGLFLAFGLIDWIIPHFIFYNLMIPVFIFIRKI